MRSKIVAKLLQVHNCADTWVMENVVENILDYVGILSTNFTTKIEHVTTQCQKMVFRIANLVTSAICDWT